MIRRQTLPVQSVLENLKTALRERRGAVLQAPAGAGKTTGVPPALLDQDWLEGRRILILEPRRLAARAAAGRMAAMLGDTVGRTVGYRVRMDSRVGPATRIEVVTEGVLTRLLQSDPALKKYGLVIFDEFHERHIDSDLGLALCLDIQGVLNESLRLLVMSATLETAPVAAVMGQVPVIDCKGRAYPVKTRYLGRREQLPLEMDVAAAVAKAVASDDGSILVFLPGAAEIRKTEAALRRKITDSTWQMAPLYGRLSRAAQDRAILPPPPGCRKIVLATNIAETSLTIEGIGTVVDSGLMRVPQFDVRSGMTRLVTRPVSRASAAQRRGRAGRTGPGVCYRLWSPEQHQILKEKNRPEILEADLAPLALELAVWGVGDPGDLKWLDTPPAGAYAEARHLLTRLGALDERGAVTRLGARLARLPLHPRLAGMALYGRQKGLGALACDLAALIGERDFIRFSNGTRNADLGLRADLLQAFRQDGSVPAPYTIDRSVCRRIINVAGDLCRRLDIDPRRSKSRRLGPLLAKAYPDRIGQLRAGSHGRYLLTSGRGASIDGTDPLAGQTWLVAAELDGDRREARIFLAAAYDAEHLHKQFAERICSVDMVEWDAERRMVVAVRKQMLDALTLSEAPLEHPDLDSILAVLLEGMRGIGIAHLPWSPDLRRWQKRVMFVRQLGAGDGNWPDVSDAGLSATLEHWLGPHIRGVYRLQDIDRSALRSALQAMLDWKQRKRLDELAPTRVTVPSGSRLPVDYSGKTPVLAVRIQEMFGLNTTPTVAGGRQPLLLHLLSPAGRPAQVTSDLAGFWQTGYHAVKKELKGRYPKHHWPEDPLRARPTARVKPRK